MTGWCISSVSIFVAIMDEIGMAELFSEFTIVLDTRVDIFIVSEDNGPIITGILKEVVESWF